MGRGCTDWAESEWSESGRIAPRFAPYVPAGVPQLSSTMPPASVHSAALPSMTNPCPLQELRPLHSLVAVLQALWATAGVAADALHFLAGADRNGARANIAAAAAASVRLEVVLTFIGLSFERGVETSRFIRVGVESRHEIRRVVIVGSQVSRCYHDEFTRTDPRARRQRHSRCSSRSSQAGPAWRHSTGMPPYGVGRHSEPVRSIPQTV